MDTNIKYIFQSGKCLNQEQLLQYMEGTLSKKSIREVEEHLSDCELCNDALEGLNLIKNKKTIPRKVLQIKAYMKKYSPYPNKRRRPVQLFLLLSVMVLALLIFILLIFWGFHFNFH